MMASVSLPVLLDTSVVSLIFRKDDKAQFYEDHIAGMRPVVSFQSLEDRSGRDSVPFPTSGFRSWAR